MGNHAANHARERFGVAPLARRLAGVVREAQQRETQEQHQSAVAYQPSELAERYEAHKRTCGWYAAAHENETPAHWYPPMFQGQEYEIYELLMRSYATRLATALDSTTIDHSWIPYFPSALARDPLRQMVSNVDPIWPHRRFCGADDWKVLQQVDGRHTVEEIARGAELDLETCQAILWILYVEGFVLCAHTRGDRS